MPLQEIEERYIRRLEARVSQLGRQLMKTRVERDNALKLVAARDAYIQTMRNLNQSADDRWNGICAELKSFLEAT
jgi:hypothetical protein